MTALSWTLLVVMSIHTLAIFSGVLLQRREPAGTLAWLLALVLLPGLGLVIYLAIGRPRAQRWQSTHAQVAAQIGRALSPVELSTAHVKTPDGAPATSHRTDGIVGLARNTTGALFSVDNRCRILPSARDTYGDLATSFRRAKHHIHLMFYIFQPDDTGTVLRDLLTEQATAGVTVRVLVDAVGSRATDAVFWRPLVDAGGQVAVFGTPSWWSHVVHRDRVDYRNHRKIVVIDGEVGFTGGINVGREYLGLNPEIGHWRDTHVRIDGPAVLGLQQAFVEDWCLATEEILDERALFPTQRNQSDREDAVLVVPSVPGLRWSPLRALYGQAIASARDRIWITNPYFIPGRFIRLALETAALRGVDVRLLLPSRSDHALVSLASRSIYGELLEAGVQIFEYQRGFVHAKTLVIDDWMGTVGSANMDMRSFELNFELNVFVFGAEFCHGLATQFTADLRDASSVTVEDVGRTGYGHRLQMAGARLLSPLL